ncbi:MAG: Hsp20/alpha crystallin family protein [Polyangiaceae bacterium]|nr:Hsp20/alpha crystallin family protein [Polyangiaceae bacterium]
MFGTLSQLERTLYGMDQLRRELDRAFDGVARREATQEHPPADLRDRGASFVLTMDVPGVAREALDLTLTGDVLTVTGARELKRQEGHSAHRQERRSYRIARSFALPQKVDAERVTARLEHGVLEIELPKAPELQPRKVAVRAA